MDFENRLNEIALRAFGKPADELTEDELDDIREALRQAEKLQNMPRGNSRSCL